MKNLKALIQVFCKTPLPGEVKTRLIPALGNDGALTLYLEMFEGLMTELADCGVKFELWITPDTHHSYFDRYKVPRFQQQGQDLGQRMKASLNAGLARTDKVILIGTDLPLIDTSYLKLALSALADNDVVLGPAEDGGYGLVGVKSEVPDIFTGINWGTDKVLSQTCSQLNLQASHYGLLPLIWDVDRPEDLPRYQAWLSEKELNNTQVDQASGAA